MAPFWDREPKLDPRFVIEPFEPAYLALSRDELEARVEAARQQLSDCRACPRCCGADRAAGELGFCRTGSRPLVSSAFPHMGEEDCLRGWRGSGTIFFSLCNLRCVFCQNADISQHAAGTPVDRDDIVELMLALEARGCHNINFVTPEHVVPQVIEAIVAAVGRGLRLPIVYNTSAYDSLESLALLDGLIDIYMPDFKFWDATSAARLSKARDYPERARAALREMQRQVGVLRTGPDGVARRGVLVRHLVMPGQREQRVAIFRWLSDELSPDTYVNIMDQYRPSHEVPWKVNHRGDLRYADINRCPYPRELAAAYEDALEAGLHRFDTRV